MQLYLHLLYKKHLLLVQMVLSKVFTFIYILIVLKLIFFFTNKCLRLLHFHSEI